MITIEFSLAWALCSLMILIMIVVVYGIIATPKDCIAIISLGVGLILLLDLLCVFGSAYYMSHPTNGYKMSSYLNTCAEYNYTSSSFDNPQQCIMPTLQDNPYEKQPLHPIAWVLGFIGDVFKTISGAVRFKVT